MQKELKNLFSNIDWVIPLPVIESVRGGKRKTQKYYSPKGKISYCYTQKNIGVNPEDI
jgi:hypothetical protein